MKIIILGAGQVGSTLAENLTSERNDITVVDLDAARLRTLQDSLDIRTVVGYASRPNVLQQAGAKDADMLIAVTSNDETNMVACQVAYTLFNTPSKIARIRSSQYLHHEELFDNKAIPIDACISPERIVTLNVQRLIEHPGALQVLDFAHGKVQLVAIKPYYGGPIVGKTLSELYEYLTENIYIKVVAIYRSNRSISLQETTTIEVGDEVFFIASKEHVTKVMASLRRAQSPLRRIFIAGGGNIGLRLAQSLENDYQVKIIEHNEERAKTIAQTLVQTTVLHGDASDRDLLITENIEYMDVFCAVTNDDEANIMSALLAKRLGARQVMALVTRTAYIDLIEGGPIDVAISPQQATIGSILTYLRKGDVVNVHSLRRGAAESIEIIAHGDEKTSKVVGRTINQINLPPGTVVGALIRGDDVMIHKEDIIVESGDHLILLVNKKHIHEVERLFQVNVTFLG